MEKIGVGMARGPAEWLHIGEIPIIQARRVNAHLDMEAAARARNVRRGRLRSGMGRLKLLTASAYRRAHIRPTQINPQGA